MAKFFQGWLPYGTDDDDVILRHSLRTTHADILAYLTANSTSVVYRDASGTGSPVPTSVDSENGLTTGTGGYVITQPGGVSNYQRMDRGFQVSMEIETRFLTTNSPENGSGNYNPATDTECPLEFRPGIGGGAQSFRRHAALVDTRLWSAHLADWAGTFHGMGHGAFTKVNFGYIPGTKGGRFVVAYDGRIIAEAPGVDTAARANLFNIMNLGSGFNGGWSFPYRIRNFQLVARPPMLNVHPLLRKVMHVGDSFTMADATTANYGDKIPAAACERYLNQRGVFLNTYASATPAAAALGTWSVAIGGATIYDTGGGENFSTRLPDLCKVQQPSCVVLFGGVNDTRNSTAGPEQPLSHFTGTTWINAYKARLDQIIDNSPSGAFVVVCTIPHYIADVSLYSSEAAYLAAFPVSPVSAGGTFYQRVEAANARIRELEGYRSKTFVADVAPKWWTGGYNLQSFLTDAQHVAAGAVSGVGNDFHPGVRGQLHMGNAMGEAILRAINTL